MTKVIVAQSGIKWWWQCAEDGRRRLGKLGRKIACQNTRNQIDPLFEFERCHVAQHVFDKGGGGKDPRRLEFLAQPPDRLAVEQLVFQAIALRHQIVALIAPPSRTMF